MSQSNNRYQAERWLLTAEEDLGAAKTLFSSGIYAQACFLTQQAGEKAVKALWYSVDADPWGHSIKKLLAEFPNKSELPDFDVWLEKATLLDKYYIPTRYPNGLPDLTPGQMYVNDDAQRGLEASRWLVNACREWLRMH